MYALGCCYYNGIDVRKDRKYAVRLFRQAADKGNRDAKFMLQNNVPWYLKLGQ